MAELPHRSIGEVLSLLKDQHPDITISKIRFLESQGLISPERTPSGYRKFFDADVDRLKWILEQQRDNFLPLKVIKRRLDSADPGSVVRPKVAVENPREPTLFSRRPEETGEVVGKTIAKQAGQNSRADTEESSSLFAAVGSTPGSVSLTTRELAETTGVETLFIDELQRLGLIAPLATTGDPVFDHEALLVAKASATFSSRGVDPRHLRMFKVAAERQAGLLEQLLGAKAHRNAEAAAEARAELEELIGLGETIQRSILHRNLGSRLRRS